MPITKEVLDEIMKDYSKPEDLLGEKGLLHQLSKALIEKALGAELRFILRFGDQRMSQDN